MIEPLTWSAPRTTGWATTEAREGTSTWRITPVPRDVCRISYTGHDADGTIVSGIDHNGYAESVEEAKIVIDLIRAGTDHLPDWREQLETAGFVRSYPEATDGLACLWQDTRKSGLFQIVVYDHYIRHGDAGETSVHATYESGRANFWHNVCRVDAARSGSSSYDDVKMRDGLPEGVDTLKVGVAAAIAIRDARTARGGRFVDPLGGAPKDR